MKTVLSFLLALALCLSLSPLALAEHDAVAVNASVAVFNPPSSTGVTGSATICGRTETHLVGVGAAHCFVGVIGGKFEVGSADGKRFPATLLAHDKPSDLALFTTSLDATIEIAPPAVCDDLDLSIAKRVSICGYPAGKGPTYDEQVTFVRQVLDDGQWRNEWKTALRVEGGSSGCGVFADGHLIGVVRAANWTGGGDGRKAYSVSNEDLTKFLAQCGPNGCWAPKPNVPVTPRPKDLNTDNKMGWEIKHLRDRVNGLEGRPLQEIIHEVPPPPAPKKHGMPPALAFLFGVAAIGGAGLYLGTNRRA